jgi:hypothetical protein
MPPGPSGGSLPLPRLGTEPPPGSPLLALAPGPEDEEEEAEQEGEPPNAPPEGPEDEGPGEESDRPPESDEEREGMPSQASLFRRTARTREAARARAHPVLEDEEHGTPHVRPDGEVDVINKWATHDAPASYKTPRVVGTRRQAALKDGDELPDDADVL